MFTHNPNKRTINETGNHKDSATKKHKISFMLNKKVESPKKPITIKLTLPPQRLLLPTIACFNQMKLLDHFKQNDLIFGLNATIYYRHQACVELKKQHTYYIANHLNMPAIQYVLNLDLIKVNDLAEYQKKHYEFLMTHRNYLTRPDGKGLKTETDKEFGAAIRRACKLLVCSANEERRIHFELDGMNIERVCKADRNDLGISNSELKAAYRKARNNSHLFFYLKGQPVAAPWDVAENQKLFQQYDQYRSSKRKS